MNADQLKEVLRLHKLWLDDEEGGERANLSNANLSFANLRSANLRSANLSNANLRSANLRSANLSNADLSNANLSFANLSNADLSSADLRQVTAGGDHHGLAPEAIGLPPADRQFLKRVCEAALGEDALDMSDWHSCDTTHCLAGWAVHLAGPAGYALEAATSPSVAGSLLIPDAAHLFYASNDEAREFCASVVSGEWRPEDASLPREDAE